MYKRQEPLVDAETGEILVEAGTVMTRDVIDSISEQLDNGLNKITYIPNDAAVLTEPVELQKFKVVAPTDPDRVVTIIGNANPSVLLNCHSSWTNTTHFLSCLTNVVCLP